MRLHALPSFQFEHTMLALAKHGTYFEGTSPLSKLASRSISKTQGLNRDK